MPLARHQLIWKVCVVHDDVFYKYQDFKGHYWANFEGSWWSPRGDGTWSKPPMFCEDLDALYLAQVIDADPCGDVPLAASSSDAPLASSSDAAASSSDAPPATGEAASSDLPRCQQWLGWHFQCMGVAGDCTYCELHCPYPMVCVTHKPSKDTEGMCAESTCTNPAPTNFRCRFCRIHCEDKSCYHWSVQMTVQRFMDHKVLRGKRSNRTRSQRSSEKWKLKRGWYDYM